jgi:hypothetical protein
MRVLLLVIVVLTLLWHQTNQWTPVDIHTIPFAQETDIVQVVYLEGLESKSNTTTTTTN